MKSPCLACYHAKSHARAHGRPSGFVVCQGHAAIDSLLSGVDESNNGGNTHSLLYDEDDNTFTIPVTTILGLRLGNWVVVSATELVVPQNQHGIKDYQWFVGVVKVAIIIEGEYTNRSWAVLALHAERGHILDFSPALVGRAGLALALAKGGWGFNTNVRGEAALDDHPAPEAEYRGRRTCPECIVIPSTI